jgi:putative membrane protein
MFGVRLVAAPGIAALGFVFAGVALGAVSGLVPGLHANNMALLLAAVAPGLPGPPRLVAAAMLAAGVVHTFLDVVPALALGVPDPAMAATALPGHRLVLQGRGREALRLSALGSGAAVAFAVPLAVPITRLMTAVYPLVRTHLPFVLGAIAVLLVVTERGPVAMAGGGSCFAASGLLGWLTLDLSPTAPLDAGGMLTPLFTGLFGAPVLVDALSGAGVPEQGDATIALPRPRAGLVAGTGTLAGAVVGYVPGVSSAVAGAGAVVVVPGRYGARGFLVAVSGVNTANTIFALFALVALGAPRTGVLVAVDRVGAPHALPLWLAAVGIAAGVGFLLVPAVGDRYLTRVGRADYSRLSLSVLAVLVALSWVFAGWPGVAVFGVATGLGLVPPRVGARRVHLMGVLMVPLVVGV